MIEIVSPVTCRDGTHPKPTPHLSLIDRFLPLWIFLAMAIGIGLGKVFPNLGDALDRVKVTGVPMPGCDGECAGGR